MELKRNEANFATWLECAIYTVLVAIVLYVAAPIYQRSVEAQNTASQQILKATKTLTDAQVKALPTTAIQILAAQGANKRTIPVQIIAHVDATAGAYTNINAAAYLVVKIDTTEFSSYVGNDATLTHGSTINQFTLLFGSATKRFAILTPWQWAIQENDWGLVSPAHDFTTEANKPLNISIINGGSGNLTGGNAANSMVVTTIYWVL